MQHYSVKRIMTFTMLGVFSVIVLLCFCEMAFGQEIIQEELIYDVDSSLVWTHKVNEYSAYLSRFKDKKTKIDNKQGDWALYDCITSDAVIYRNFNPNGIKITEVVHSGSQVEYFVDSNLEWEVIGREVHFENEFYTPSITAIYRSSSSADTLDVFKLAYRDGDYLVVEFESVNYPVYIDPSLVIVSTTTGLINMYTAHAVYATSRETTPAVTSISQLRFGNILVGDYYVWRQPYTLDLTDFSSLGDTVYVFDSARIAVLNTLKVGTPIDSMVVVKATYTGHASNKANMNSFEGYNAGSPHTPTILSDYFDNTAVGGVGWYYIKLNAAGLDSLQSHLGDSLTVIIMSTLDMHNVPPTGNNQLYFDGPSEANPAQLELFYTATAVLGDILGGSQGTIIRKPIIKRLSFPNNRIGIISQPFKKRGTN